MPKAVQNPIGAAMDWVAKIVAAALMMVLPGLGGQWLDEKLDTRVFTLPGFLLGLVGGIWYLLAITSKKRSASSPSADEPPENGPPTDRRRVNTADNAPAPGQAPTPGQEVSEDARD